MGKVAGKVILVKREVVSSLEKPEDLPVLRELGLFRLCTSFFFPSFFQSAMGMLL